MSDILEPFAVPEIFADGIGNVAVVGGVFRCTFFEADGKAKVAVLKLRMPAEAVLPAATRDNVVALFKDLSAGR